MTIILPVLNRIDLLEQALASIDVPVEKLLIVDNSGGALDLNEIRKKYGAWVLSYGSNLGYSASINAGFHACKPPWLTMSNDMVWDPGSIAKLLKAHEEHPEMVLICSKLGLIGTLWTPKAIEQVGYLDENFHPAYFEDVDWWRRLVLSGAPTMGVQEATGKHVGSATIKSDPDLERKNALTSGANGAYYCKKWGGEPRKEIFTHPFNDPNWPITKWVLDCDHYERNWKIWNP